MTNRRVRIAKVILQRLREVKAMVFQIEPENQKNNPIANDIQTMISAYQAFVKNEEKKDASMGRVQEVAPEETEEDNG